MNETGPETYTDVTAKLKIISSLEYERNLASNNRNTFTSTDQFKWIFELKLNGHESASKIMIKPFVFK